MLEKILTYFEKSEEKALIKAAYDLAWRAHLNQKRESGEPYIQHPLGVALMLTKMNLDTETVAAALLHDVVEDTEYTLDDIENNFGKTCLPAGRTIAFLVNGVTKLDKIKYSGAEGKTENLRKMFLAMAKDIRVVLIKLADRYDNIQTLNRLPKEKQQRIALETLEIYAPIAYRLGMGELKGQLEDLAFKYLHPEKYEWLKNEVTGKYETHKAHINKLRPVIYEIFKNEEIVPLEVHARTKHFYSLYKKLLRYQMDFDKIHDLVAARITMKNVEDCYLALGAIHQVWKPVPGLIKDYIATPKPNGYQSLHTSVFGPEGKITEIQIRTPEMHERAENGITAHWAYKEHSYFGRDLNISKKELAWVEQLREWQKAARGSDEFLQSLKIDFLKERIFVLTPKGDALDLPEGATPVDFAYAIHSDIGHQCAGARINGKIMPLNTELQSGDAVEILIQKNKKPSEDWLGFVKTNLAKERIRSVIKLKTSAKGGSAFGGKNKKIKTLSAINLRVVVRDRIGILKDVTNIISSRKINILSAKSEGAKDPYHYLNFSIESKNKQKLEELILAIKKTKGVEEISFKL